MAFSTINHLSPVYWHSLLSTHLSHNTVTPLIGSLNQLIFYKTINVFILIYRILWGLSVKSICICLCFSTQRHGLCHIFISFMLLACCVFPEAFTHPPLGPFFSILIFWSCLLKHKALCGKTLLEVYRGQILPHLHSTITV